MTETLRVRPAKMIYSAIVTSFLVLVVSFFWLALSATSPKSGLLPGVFATMFGWVASILIRRPFALVLNANGVLIETPFGDSFFDWSGFEWFAIRYVDPLTKHIVLKLKPDVEVPPLYKKLRLADHEVGLFPFFEIGNNELLRIMRQYQHSS